jgi:glycosyltransferase involved in cell wall biosynthesis
MAVVPNETARQRQQPRPSVSIIIPYYMQQQYIREAVLSAVNQGGAQLDIIVIDDGSPVPAAPILTGIEGIRLVRTANQGCPAARNFGFQQSTGTYLIFLDGDDVLHPGAVQAQLNALANEPQAALSFGAARVIDESGRELAPPYVCKPRKNYLRALFEFCPMRTPGMAMIRREAFLEAGGFNSDWPAQVDDYELYLRIARRHSFFPHRFCVLSHRRHSTNYSNDRKRMLRGTLEVLDHLAASGTLSAAERRWLSYGRTRWIHHYNPEPTLEYQFRTLYFKFRTMVSLPPSLWF